MLTLLQFQMVNISININDEYKIKYIKYCSCKAVMVLGMLNDYRKFDYRIKCSISFSFVSHSILELLIFRVSVTVGQRRREVTDGVTQYRRNAVCRLTSPVASCRRLFPHGRVSGGAVGDGGDYQLNSRAALGE